MIRPKIEKPQCFNIEDCEATVWVQMFFEDGSVSEGKRTTLYWCEDYIDECLNVAVYFLNSLNRTSGLLLIWGAGIIEHRYYDIGSIASFSQVQESDS